MSQGNNIGIVILAAGASVRMGKPKQLLEYEGKRLIQHVTDVAINSDADPVIVVLGANADLVAKELDQNKIHIARNSEWEEGMASSIRVGLKTLQKIAPSVGAVILMVCDQPHVSQDLLNNMISAHIGTGKPIVTSDYGDVMGPPALFHRSFFAEFMKLKGDAGARKIIQQQANEVDTIPFPKGKIDIDTLKDYEALRTT